MEWLYNRVAGGLRRVAIACALASLCAPVLCATAWAADPAGRKDSGSRKGEDKASDLRKSLDDDLPGALGWLRGSRLEITATIPLTYNTLATRPDSESGGGAKGDFHSNPEFALKWSKQFDHVRISATAATGVDRYRQAHDVDMNVGVLSLKAYLTDGKSHIVTPYASYTSTREMARDYRDLYGIYNEAAIGFVTGIGFDEKGKRISSDDATEDRNWAIDLDVKGGRRMSDYRPAVASFVVADLTATYTLNKYWAFTANPNLRVRFHENYHDEFRRDVRLGMGLKAAWTPDWLTKIVPKSEINFVANYFNTISNIPGKSTRNWEIGPTLVLSRKL